MAGDVIIGFEEEADGAGDVGGATETADDAVPDEAVVLAGSNAGFGHPGGGDPRTHDVDTDSGGTAALLRQYQRRVLEGCLLRGVDGGAREESVGLHSGNEDDGARDGGGLHARGSFTCEQDGAQVVGVVTAVHGGFELVGIGGAGGVSGEDDHGVGLRGGVKEAGSIGGGGKVGLDERGGIPPAPGAAAILAKSDDDPRTLGEEEIGEGSANTAGSAGEHDLPALQ